MESSLKTLLLLRHAKSSWDEPLPDPMRPLAPRGRKAAPRMGAYMARNGLIPQRVLCSHARRAVETWELVAERLKADPVVEIREDLYHAHPESLLTLLQALTDSEDTVLMVGHNPTFEDLARDLTGGGDPEAIQELRRKYPTGALATLDFRVPSWDEVRVGEGYLRDFMRPKALKS